jgi:hypothetical protein
MDDCMEQWLGRIPVLPGFSFLPVYDLSDPRLLLAVQYHRCYLRHMLDKRPVGFTG